MASPSRFSVVEGSFVACRRDIVYTVHKTIAQANGQCPHREAMRGEKISPPARNTYRHGDLRRALIEAGTALARDGGPDAVVLREATRRAGVVPNAAYRHFASRQELLQAVRAAALSALAVAMETELARLRRRRSPAAMARARLRAIGTGYLHFAQAEPGLFRTAFVASDDLPDAVDPDKAGNSGLDPFQLLGVALDGLVETGV